MPEAAAELDAAREGAPTDRGCPACGRTSPPDARFCAWCGHRLFVAEGEAELPVADPLIGRTLAERYRIEQMIGRGGMGVVYRVEHVRIGKAMAMKLLHGELARDPSVIRRFRREAEAASKLDHPHTVQVFDFGRSEGLMYLVMELLGGKDLGAIVEQEGALPFARVARIAAQIASSIQQAHARGVLHRDLKPENVRILSDRGEPDHVKVMDFGLAKLREGPDESAGASITRAGFIVGTPYYMAPEHIRGERVDARSDVYALGALMYKCLTGVPPFWAPTPVGVLTRHLTDPVVPPSVRSPRRDVPPEADAIVLRAMQKSPADRYQTMEELRRDLLAWLRDHGEPTGPTATGRIGTPAAAARTASGREVGVATRDDVDRYERALRRQAFATNLGIVLLLGALAAAGAYGFRAWQRGAGDVAAYGGQEREPNDVPAEAGELPEGVEARGYLGARQRPDLGDADVWVLRNPARSAGPIRLDFSGLPNMDTVLEIFASGQSEPLLVVDAAGLGRGERVPNFPISDATYYVRVREVSQGRFPTENVSDNYSLRWRRVERQDGDERELNDTVALAERIAPGQTRRGYVGWNGDVDVFCLSEDAQETIVTLDPVRSLDLVLRVEERVSGRSTIHDDGGLGEGERAVLWGATAEATCLAVAADAAEGPSADPDERWTLRLARSEGAVATP